MATLHVRNVPEPLYEALRTCADEEGRSIGAQAIVLLEAGLLGGGRSRFRIGARRRATVERKPLFHRFTGRARETVRFAQDEARRLQHDYIGTEHILLGLLHDEASVASKALRQLNLDQERLRAHIEEVVGIGPGTPSGPIHFTPRAKKILELALREALALHHHYIGTEHILLAIGREGEGVAALALAEQGVDEAHIRGVVIALLSGLSGREAAVEQSEPQYLAVDLEGPAEQWTSHLNDLADDGWELVSLQQLGEGTRAVLRRPE